MLETENLGRQILFTPYPIAEKINCLQKFIYLFIYLLHENLLPLLLGRRVNFKEREGRRAKKKKGIEAERVKPRTPTRENGTLIREKEQKEDKKWNKEKENYIRFFIRKNIY